jgi:hypothetical protein
LFGFAATVLTFFIAGFLYLLRFERVERVDNLGAYSILSETGLLIPSVDDSYLAEKSLLTFNSVMRCAEWVLAGICFLEYLLAENGHLSRECWGYRMVWLRP